MPAERSARFYATEDTASAFDRLGRHARQSGLPASLCVEHDSIYVVSDQEARERARRAGKKPPMTQLGRAMGEPGVRTIAVHSPQAKGRVERMNRALQDRLLKDLSVAIDGRVLHDLAAASFRSTEAASPPQESHAA